MFQGLTGWHLLIVLAVILLLFGATRLPGLAKSLGQSARVFKGEMKAMKDDDAASGEKAAPVVTSVAEPTTATSTTTTPPDSRT